MVLGWSDVKVRNVEGSDVIVRGVDVVGGEAEVLRICGGHPHLSLRCG